MMGLSQNQKQEMRSVCLNRGKQLSQEFNEQFETTTKLMIEEELVCASRVSLKVELIKCIWDCPHITSPSEGGEGVQQMLTIDFIGNINLFLFCCFIFANN